MADSYYSYGLQCVIENDAKLKPRNTLIEYHRNKKGKPIGVILAYREGDEVRVGTSLCHRTEPHGFNKDIGINKAMHAARPLKKFVTPITVKMNVFKASVAWGNIPNTMRKHVEKVVLRAYKYFKDVPGRPLNTEGEIPLPENPEEYQVPAKVVFEGNPEQGYSASERHEDYAKGAEFPIELEAYKRELGTKTE